MSNDVQKQYDRLDDVASILQRMKEVYAIPYRHTRYVATKEFFRAKMNEGSSVQEHGVKMLPLVKKLKDLKAGLDNDTYIDVILQSLPPSYDPFIVNFNMNGLEKSLNELINMLVQYEATIKKSGPSVLIGEASTSKAKGKRARRWKKKKGKAKAKTVVVAKDAKSAPVAPVGMQGRVWVLSSSRGQTISAPIAVRKGIGREIVPIYLPIKVLQRSRKLSEDEVVLRLGEGKAVAAEAVGIINLVISDRIRLELKDCYFVPSMIKNIISIMLDNSGWMMTAQNKRKLDNFENAQIWHARLGHISQDRMKRLVDSRV
ncbi:hypothetical protein Sango_1053900 [Sesamum angolense]|uniref:GAG-pre-integrase domain-containing protein n=1 Tax=Sesamum angolense TaxID=2727404 RepID=A0AAE1X0M9_9LAMI|nr:hypothetical protein Sango_1053900 [Sesamum angolense]